MSNPSVLMASWVNSKATRLADRTMVVKSVGAAGIWAIKILGSNRLMIMVVFVSCYSLILPIIAEDLGNVKQVFGAW